MKKSIIAIFFTLASFTYSYAQDEVLVKDCLNNYLDGLTKGDTARLNRAFHNLAMLRTINASSGKMVDFPVKKFISGTPQGGMQAKTKILSYSLIGQSAVATVELAFADFKYVDYLSLLKVGNDWKIVCRVFSRTDLSETPTNFGATGTTASNKKVVKAKPKSDDGW
jgi:Putative lumazine-binding